MKQKIILLCLCLFCTGRSTYAQWVVSDPTNLAQGIVNSTKQVVEAAKNGQTMLQSFQETVKIYEQGKRYYDALKSVSNLVRSARKVQQCILLVGAVASYMSTAHCGLCGMGNCGNAMQHGTTCAFSGINLGIALGSAVGIAASHHIDNRIMFSAGKAAMKENMFSRRVTMAFGIPLSVSGKNIFYDRNMISIAKPLFVD